MPSGAAPTKRLKFVYSMEMRSAHGSAGGPVVVAWLAKGGVDCSDVGAGELRAAEVGAAEGLGATMGGAAASVFDFSSGGAMSRASTGKRCACCSDHLAARPFSGLFVLYSW